uniref:Axonemal dynein light intermediate polypeptide 1 n=1 Tax=Erpetoichthys calabaricus TaxID=27687 RepID=A0A8C4S4Z1_ERPCA
APRFRGKSQLPPITSPAPTAVPCLAYGGKQEMEVLDQIFPPREWMDNNNQYIQYVCRDPCTRTDLSDLQDELDSLLLQRNAREVGLCSVRRELYKQCFDELLRQVTIGCAERGLLLMRIRTEIETTIAAYKTLHKSSMAYGMRKSLQAEQNRIDLDKKITELELENNELQKQLNEQKAKCDAIEKCEEVQRQVEERNHNVKVELLRQTNQMLCKPCKF